MAAGFGNQTNMAGVEDEEEDERLCDLLENNMAQLCENIDPRKFMVHLRSQRVISKDDCEDIRSHVVSTDRAVKFLDIIMTKGGHGIRAFLQHLGYLYPGLYEKLMKEEAPNPPTDYFKRLSQSSELSPPLVMLIDSLLLEHKQKKEISEQLEVLKKQAEELQEEKLIMQESLQEMDRLQADNERLRRERKQEQVENSRINERALQYVEQRDHLQVQCQQLRGERDDVKDQLAVIEQEHDALRMQLKNAESASKNRIQSSERRMTEQQEIKRRSEELQQENRALRYQLDQYKAGQVPCKVVNLPRPIPDCQKNIVEELKISIDILNDQVKQYRDESEDTARLLAQRETDLHHKERLLDNAEAKLDQTRVNVETLEQQRKIDSQRKEEIWKHLQNVKTERDQALEQMSEMSRRWQAISSERDHLAKQLQQQIKQCELVEQENYDLRKENSSAIYMRRRRVINVKEYEQVKLPNKKTVENKHMIMPQPTDRDPFQQFPSFRGIHRGSSGEEEWLVTVKTSDLFGAGTDANVTLVLYGWKNEKIVKSEEIQVTTKNVSFKSNSSVSFKIITPNMGCLYKVRIGHDNSGTGPGWHLDHIVLNLMGTDQKYIFIYKNWLNKKCCGPQIIQEIGAKGMNIVSPPPVLKYVVEVVTAANVHIKKEDGFYVTVYGEYGDTGRRLFYHSRNKSLKQQASVNELVLSAVSLGKLLKVRVHCSGETRWFVQKVTATELSKPKESVVWECNSSFPHPLRNRPKARAVRQKSDDSQTEDESICTTCTAYNRRGIFPTYTPRSDTLCAEAPNSMYRSDPEDDDLSDGEGIDSGRPDSLSSEELIEPKMTKDEELATLSQENLGLLEEVFPNKTDRLDKGRCLDTLETVKCSVNGSILKQCVVGGNNSGLFIGPQVPQTLFEKLKEGYQLIQVQEKGTCRDWCMVDVTFEDAHRLFEVLIMDVEVTLINNPTGYKHLQSFLKSEDRKMRDSLFIRSDVTREGEDSDSLTLNSGDIIHITDTVFGYNKWFGTKLDVRTGAPTSLTGRLPSVHAKFSNFSVESLRSPEPSTADLTGRCVSPWSPKTKSPSIQPSRVGDQDIASSPRSPVYEFEVTIARSMVWTKPKKAPPPRPPKATMVMPPSPDGTALTSKNMQQPLSTKGSAVGTKPYTFVKPYKGKLRRPVILYCKDDFLDQVKDNLSLSFIMDVPRETQQLTENDIEALVARGQLVHHVRNGDTYSCLFTRTLIEMMKTESSKHILLQVPVECLTRLHSVNMFPIVIVVKTRDSFHIKHNYENELLEKTIQFDYICFGLEELRNVDTVCKKLCDHVNKLQQNLVWVPQLTVKPEKSLNY